ncbi:TetR family transcriptional regulator [Rossellomorea aquimaris]|uniref:TetR/AcrR family transcriptional regulator n=1 Tax=Rossellomorea aquimaris TaxID=189382 RepID=UPI001CD50D13|nr:TetR family transcriptional regulator [Rossellomorea aquimaris]MCA1053980.1 TetR family transcriptional regulator [Rossellomorea aquimaris]
MTEYDYQKKAPGRPRSNQDVAKKELIRSATALFSTKGFEETSLREIALDANVNMALIKYHFGSKMDLWKEVILKLSREVLETNTFKLEEVQDASDMREMLRELFDKLVDMTFEHREFSLFIMNESVQKGERFDYLFELLIRPFHEQSYPFIIKGIELGVLAEQDPEELIVMLLSSVAHQQAAPHIMENFTNVTKEEGKWKEVIKHSLKVNFIK